MRPERLSPGNPNLDGPTVERIIASMRPERLSPGNPAATVQMACRLSTRFNEAGAVKPRKSGRDYSSLMYDKQTASMRPERLSPGNLETLLSNLEEIKSFNEAGAVKPRKSREGVQYRRSPESASMRPERLSPGNQPLNQSLLDKSPR